MFFFFIKKENQWNPHKTVVWNQILIKMSKLITVPLTGLNPSYSKTICKALFFEEYD